MSSEEAPQQDATGPTEPEEVLQPPTEPAAMATANKKRPRLDLTTAAGARERKRGKSMFGILVGTLNKAKIEDKERNASEAAKKRQLIEQRLQNKLRKETDSVRRAEEAKKDKTAANRKEEELQLKDSIYKLRRTRLPLLSNFLLTSDTIPTDDDDSSPSTNPLTSAPRSHPPPLYYLPAILTPAQESFIARRKAEVHEAAEKEWQLFREERTTGITEINQLRQRVAEEEERRKAERGPTEKDDEMDTDPAPQNTTSAQEKPAAGGANATVTPAIVPSSAREVEMDVDDTGTSSAPGEEPKESVVEQERKEEPTQMQADDDDAVEY